jgi:hypothetical protein
VYRAGHGRLGATWLKGRHAATAAGTMSNVWFRKAAGEGEQVFRHAGISQASLNISFPTDKLHHFHMSRQETTAANMKKLAPLEISFRNSR